MVMNIEKSLRTYTLQTIQAADADVTITVIIPEICSVDVVITVGIKIYNNIE
jgi:hypothetical protein